MICLANPSFYKVYPAAIGSILPIPAWAPGPLTELDTSIFGNLLAGKPSDDDASILLFGVLAGVGYLSFILNARRFSLPRFLVYTAAVVFWALVRRYVLEFAPVFAVVMVLNGQEWYQDRFGTQGHLGRGWAFWSTGGRALTLAALGTILVFRVVLGWWTIPGEPQFGFGFREGEFAFEAADLLRDAPIEGNVFNMWLKEGDALIWRAYPKRKVFIDSRRHLYGPELVNKYVALRGSLRDDDVAAWKPLLDEYGVSAVMIDTVVARNTYQSLSLSRNWIRFYDDGDHAALRPRRRQGRGPGVLPQARDERREPGVQESRARALDRKAAPGHERAGPPLREPRATEPAHPRGLALATTERCRGQ